MDNQHRQIKGYRELDEHEIHLINSIKTKANEIGELVHSMERLNLASPGTVDPRWLAIAKTQLQQGFMALTRAAAKPDFF